MIGDTVIGFVILCESPSRAIEVGDRGQGYSLIFLDLWDPSPLSLLTTACLLWINKAVVVMST